MDQTVEKATLEEASDDVVNALDAVSDNLDTAEAEVEGQADVIDAGSDVESVKDEFNELAPDSEVPEEEYEGPVEGINLKLPAGMKPDNPELVGFMKMIKESGTKSEHAQKFLDMYIDKQKKIVTQFTEAEAKFRENINRKWIEENKADPEFGGNNYNRTTNYVQAALRRFVPKDELLWTTEKDGKMGVLEFFRVANLKNCPPLMRLLARVGKATGEAQPITSNVSVKEEKELSYADALFGDIK